MDIKNFIDLHMHIGPEVIPRKFTVQELVEEENGRIRGMALKNHFYSTTPLIKGAASEGKPLLIGSVTLNNYVGGLNPDAVYAAASLSKRPIIVWFPTIHAENFLSQSKYETPSEWGASSARLSGEIKGIKILANRNLTDEAMNVLETVKENECVLATGHISWQESKALVEEAIDIGIRKIIITHPIYQLIDMPIQVQAELSSNKGVYIEHNYAMYLIDKIPIEKTAGQIKSVGPEKCIISSDMGQTGNPAPSKALEVLADLLKRCSITEKELKTMGEGNPANIIGLD